MSRTRTKQENLLGSGLAQAVEKLKEPVALAFVEEVRSLLLDDFCNAHGTQALKAELTAFAEGDLAAWIDKAEGDRRDLLQKMQERLLKLARELKN